MSFLIYIIVLFCGLYLSLYVYLHLCPKHVYLGFYTIMIASLQGNHGYYFSTQL